MAYIIGSILILITLIIFGLIWRKRVYDEVDRLEAWKMDIMNRNVTSELSKVKALNLSGETQENFEKWKERWDSILTRELPDMEEYLFDAEEAADKYRMPTAKQNLLNVGGALKAIEADIEQMFIELEQLLDSEENSRNAVEELKPRVKELRKKLLQNRHNFGNSEVRFELALDELNQMIDKYHQLTDDGNYFEAQKQVDELKGELDSLEGEIEEFPAIYKTCKQTLPNQLDDLLTGIIGMKNDGYHIDHLGFEKEIHRYQAELLECLEHLEKGVLDEIPQFIEHVEERMKEMYQLLEKEAIAKNYVLKQLPGYRKELKEELRALEETRLEVETLQESYYFEDNDMETHLSLEKKMKLLKDQLEEIDKGLNEQKLTHIELRDKVEAGFKELEDLTVLHEQFRSQIQTLRKDEIEAKELILDMRKAMQNSHRMLMKSNIPGVPSYIWKLLEDASIQIEEVTHKLEKQPLDIGEIQHSLAKAEDVVHSMTEQTDMLLEQARLVELVIQYANRYRSQYPLLSARLSEAESLFRKYEYESALEEAVQALEDIEPGALKRLEEYNKVPG
ncbi:septation ring formation regulator EzrA [Sediminibacillus albus]|uniref:Septation ring formation regulator EzrA n=1 Tax=Sediminibacillus albus TaxID=407036 RepID=A0A1G9BW69_9BACI|nr:septation ring formation regulator EzrA [Sediminibacillus albus]SDK43640.1 septation ring formation regulator [Sediminibacillus albus]